jgi:hypothetical protein
MNNNSLLEFGRNFLKMKKPQPESARVLEIREGLKKDSEQALREIALYCEKNDLVLEHLTVNGVKILTVHEKNYQMDEAFSQMTSRKFKEIEKSKLNNNNCKPISYELKNTAGFTDILKGENTDKIVYGFHYLPVKQTKFSCFFRFNSWQ